MSAFLGLTFGKNFWSRMLTDANYEVMQQNMYLDNITLQYSQRETDLNTLMSQITDQIDVEYNADVNDYQLQFEAGELTASQLNELISDCQEARDNAVEQMKKIIEEDDVLTKLQQEQKSVTTKVQMAESRAQEAQVQYEAAKEVLSQRQNCLSIIND